MRLLFLGAGMLLSQSCLQPECANPDYSQPECRVQAENELARLTTADGVELRFEDPARTASVDWDARGVWVQRADGRVMARVSTLGSLRFTVHPGARPTDLTIEVHNVDPRIATLTGEVERHGLQRVLKLRVEDEIIEVHGELPQALCAKGFSLAVVGDIQTNPVQFQRIIQDLHLEAADAKAAGTPLLGLVLLGDLSEDSKPEEMDVVRDMLRASPVPAAAIPGNHDVYATKDATFARRFGPGTLAFDVCDAHLALFDTASGSLARSVVGRFPELLDTDKRFLIAGMHHPPMAGRTSSGWTAEDQALHLVAELAARKADLVLAGHMHRRMVSDAGPVRQIISGTAGATQVAANPDYGYTRLTFEADKVRSCFVRVPPIGPVSPMPASRRPMTCH